MKIVKQAFTDDVKIEVSEDYVHFSSKVEGDTSEIHLPMKDALDIIGWLVYEIKQGGYASRFLPAPVPASTESPSQLEITDRSIKVAEPKPFISMPARSIKDVVIDDMNNRRANGNYKPGVDVPPLRSNDGQQRVFEETVTDLGELAKQSGTVVSQ